jgi:hypothetical protein
MDHTLESGIGKLLAGSGHTHQDWGFCEHFGYQVPLSKYDIHHKRLLLYYLIHDESLLGLPRAHTLLSITPPCPTPTTPTISTQKRAREIE